MSDYKDIMEGGMKWLEANDLDRFYDYLVNEKKVSVEVGYITRFLEECGINTLASLRSGCVPRWFGLGNLPKSMLTDGCLKFPPNIYFISEDAFAGVRLECLDLRNIDSVQEGAFISCKFNHIYLSDKAYNYDDGALYSGSAGIIHIPKDMDMEIAKELIARLYAKNLVVWNDNIEGVERY